MLDSPAYQVAGFVTKIISPVLGQTEYAVPNSSAFVQEVRALTLSKDDMLVSFDVKSLFTRVPTDEAIDAICAKLREDDTLSNRCALSVESIGLLMKECLNCGYFQCNGQFYNQLEGAPMGLSLSVALANGFMESLEEKLLETAQLKPKYWRRYVDDTFVIWQHGNEALDQFHQHLNDECPSIQFTREVEEDGKLPFLDVEVTRNGDKLKTTVYRKPTSSNVYLHYDSHHADSIKTGVIKCLAKRAKVVCSEEDGLREETAHLEQVFRGNGYPREYMRRALKNKEGDPTEDRGPKTDGENRQETESSSDQPQPTARDPTEDQGPEMTDNRHQPTASRPRPTYISMPYVKGTSEKIARILAPHQIRLGHSSKPTLRDKLVRAKDAVPKDMRKGVVYKTACNCGATYVGETGRPKSARLKEHVAALKHGRSDVSPLAEHWMQCRQQFDPGQAITLAVEPTWSRRVVREAIEIRLCNPSLNQGVGKFSLSPIWDSVLKK